MGVSRNLRSYGRFSQENGTRRYPPVHRNSRNASRGTLADGTASRISLTLDSTLASVSTIEDTALEFAQSAGFDSGIAPNLAMVAGEAAANAVIHGNAYDPAKRVTATFEIAADALIITVADQGPGLDLNAIPNPLAPENLLRASGRGVFLMRAFMDEVHFRQLNPGTEITLIKRRPAAA